VDAGLLHECLREPYFALSPPKSTGRELFNLAWLDERLEFASNRLPFENVQATLAELTASTIVTDLLRLGAKDCRLLVCGGGAHNRDLLVRLARLLGRKAQSTAEFGLAPDWVEAAAFAWLARARLHGDPGNTPSVTGAQQAVILGGIYYGSALETRLRPVSHSSGYAEPKTA
jgi:anhydro-N-acetylmuramic acid kinase